MKCDVTDVDPGTDRDGKGLDGTIEVLVVKRVFVMPHASGRGGDLVAHDPDTIVPVIRFNLVYHCAGPSFDRWLLAHCGPNRRKAEKGRTAANTILLV